MSWYRCISLSVVFVLVQQLAAVEGSLTQRSDNLQHDQRRLQDSEPKDSSVSLIDSGYLANNDFCTDAHYVHPGDVINGNTDFATEDSETTGECVSTSLPGIWFSTNGTGEWLSAIIQHVNHTEVAIFKGDDCDALTCLTPKQAITNAKASRGVTTDWATEKNQSYYIYVYGIGDFQLAITKYARPENDQPQDATELKFGQPVVGSTDFATSDSNITACESSAENSAAGGVWYTINGTGTLLQAHVKTEKEIINSKVSIYTSSFDCVANIETIQYYDNRDYLDWYPISNAYIWQSTKETTYFVLVQGEEGGTGSFEITISEDDRPQNDDCSGAIPLAAGKPRPGLTNFANLDDVTTCNSQSTEEKPTAPGIWYTISNLEGAYKVSVSSDYFSQLTVFSGTSCDELVCIEGTHNRSPDTITHDVAPSSSLAWNATSDLTYYILVHGSESLVGDFNLIVTPADDTTAQSETTATALSENSVQTTAMLSFGFFPNVPLRTPSTEDVDSLMQQTDEFFSLVLKDSYDDTFVRFEVLTTDIGYDEDNDLPINITFTATSYFVTPESVPTSEDVLSVMSEADFDVYIRSHVWQAEPFGSNLFFQTLRVVFGEGINKPSNGGSAGAEETSVQRVTAKGMLIFGFFPYTTLRQPTQHEVEALVDQTIAFFTSELDNKYDDFVRFGALDTSVVFDEEDRLPVTVSLEFHVFFSTLKSDEDNDNEFIHTPEEILDTMSGIDLTGYIQNFVWESKPFSENIFYETMQAIFRPDESGDMEETVSPSETSAPLYVASLPDNKALFHVSLSFNFHNTDTTAIRAPEDSEIAGLMNQTGLFFTELLQTELPESSGFSQLRLVAKSLDFKEDAEFPVVVYAEVRTFFTEDSNVEDHATAAQILALMETADMAEYVEYYVWFSEPVGSVFFSTYQAVLEPYTPDALDTPESTGNPAPSNQNDVVTITTTDGTTATLIRVEADITLLFDFFFGTDISNGIRQDELASLTTQTKDFCTKVLRDQFPDLVRLDVHLVTAGHAESTSVLPTSVVTWKLEALFDLSKDDPTEEEKSSEQLLEALTASDVEDYLHNYVWSSPPIGHNLFFNTEAVRFEHSSGGTAVVERTPAPNTNTTSTTTSKLEVLIPVTLSYGFLPDQIIDEKPSGVELQGVMFQTSLFFNKLFRDSFATDIFERCETGIKNVDLMTTAELPISIFYELKLTFSPDGSSSDSIPTKEEIAQTMEGANFEDYIVLYIWNADANSGSPDSIFYDTQQVLFEAMV